MAADRPRGGGAAEGLAESRRAGRDFFLTAWCTASSPPHPFDDVFAARRRRDDTAGAAHRPGGVRRPAGGTLGGGLTGALTWAGTFHAIGARLLREYAPRIGLEPTFTIHDREDSADQMNLVRHDLGLSAKESRFPTKATCLAIYSRAVNRAGTGGGAGAIIPVVLRLGRRVARNRSIRSAPRCPPDSFKPRSPTPA